MTRDQMTDEMCSLIGGRVAEEIINGQPSTGALNDLERLTKMAYSMVCYYGMSDRVGTVSFYDSTGSRAYDLNRPYSEKTAEVMDEEVKKLVREIHDKTLTILTENMDGFLQLAALLMEKEVIFADDLERIFGPRAGAVKAGETAAKESAEAQEAAEKAAETATAGDNAAADEAATESGSAEDAPKNGKPEAGEPEAGNAEDAGVKDGE